MFKYVLFILHLCEKKDAFKSLFLKITQCVRNSEKVFKTPKKPQKGHRFKCNKRF